MKPTLSTITILDDRKDRIKYMSKMIEHYFIGIKLIDDCLDWKDDL